MWSWWIKYTKEWTTHLFLFLVLMLKFGSTKNNLFKIEVDNPFKPIWHDQAGCPLERVLVLRDCTCKYKLSKNKQSRDTRDLRGSPIIGLRPRGVWYFHYWMMKLHRYKVFDPHNPYPNYTQNSHNHDEQDKISIS